MKLLTRKMIVLAISACMLPVLNAQETVEPSPTTFKFGGFAKTDFMLTQYNNGAYSGAGRDFHIPSTIPVGGVDVNKYSDFHVKESRLNFDVSTLAGGKKLRAFIEMDFMLSGHGDERVSNSYNPRMRHFYLEYDKLLFGQTWSTFMIVILPDDLDFTGAGEGIVFVRQPMARLTVGGFQVALENQFTTITPNVNDPTIAPTGRYTSETGILPDLVLRYNMKLGESKLSFAAIGRHLHYKEGDNTSHSMLGTGASVGGEMKIGSKDDLRFVGTAGIGLGRYLGLNFVNSSVVNNNAELQPIPTVNGFVAYLHHWSSKFRSSFNGSYMYAINDKDIVGAVNNRAASISGNFIFQPVSKFLIGAEAMWGYREVVGGANGDFVRIQFSAKYAFSFKTTTGK